MKKKETIFEEIPHTEHALKCYLTYADKAITDSQNRIKALIIAKSEAERRLNVINLSQGHLDDI